MATITQDKSNTSTTPASVLELLDNLRKRIRWYVVIEGIAMVIICLVLAFWIGLALDYLPVLVGANEMPRTARIVLLLTTAMVTFGVVYYYILRRVFSTFRDSSLALLIERHFPSFRDSLVTTVEMGEGGMSSIHQADRDAIRSATADSDSELGTEMLARTVDRAKAGVSEVELSRVFSYTPLATKVVGAVVAVGSLILLAVMGSETFATGASRLLLISDEPWARRAHIEMVGFDENGQRKIAKGTDLIVRVRADATREDPTPDLCTILYETADGDSGRLNMSRDGEPSDGYQYYVFNGKPFKSVLNDINFDVIGWDHRLRDQRVKVVLSPVVTAVQLRSELPAYTELLPKEETWTPGTQLPIGSKISARIQTSKDLVSATIKDIDSAEEKTIEFPSEGSHREVLHEIDELSGRVALSISLIDKDGIESLEPYLLTIGAIEDEIPKVDLALRGIGNAITANARLLVEGTIKDDYQIARNWFDLKIGDKTREFDFPLRGDEQFSIGLDLQAEAAVDKEKPFALKPQDRIIFSLKASDKFDLGGQSHVGSNEPTTLTVVRPDELLAILDGRELGLRRRFEQIRTEVLQSRDSLSRLRASFKEEPVEDANASADEDEATAKQNLADLRERWANWASQKSDQTVVEVEGVALAFEDIREELTNNRVDTPERKSRLDEQIIVPLRAIATDLFPEFDNSLSQLQAALASADNSSEQQSIQVVENADNIIVAMDAILAKMLELEDYAEIVNIVRQIIEQQEKLIEKTKEEQKANVLDLLK